MPLYKTKAIVLKSQRWGEADRIVTVYSEQAGKVRGIANGARRMKSRFGGSLEPFRLIDLTLFEKNSESLARISQADITEPFEPIRENLDLMTAAACMVNVVLALTPDRDPNHAVFQALLDGLASLDSKNDPALCALLFQIHILGHTGFRPQIDHCVECGKYTGMVSAIFSPQSGGIVCRSCYEHSYDRGFSISPGSLAFIQQARRLPFNKAIRLRAAGQVRMEVEQVVEACVRVVSGKTLPALNVAITESLTT